MYTMIGRGRGDGRGVARPTLLGHTSVSDWRDGACVSVWLWQITVRVSSTPLTSGVCVGLWDDRESAVTPRRGTRMGFKDGTARARLERWRCFARGLQLRASFAQFDLRLMAPLAVHALVACCPVRMPVSSSSSSALTTLLQAAMEAFDRCGVVGAWQSIWHGCGRETCLHARSMSYRTQHGCPQPNLPNRYSTA